jgi:hypothetical protein
MKENNIWSNWFRYQIYIISMKNIVLYQFGKVGSIQLSIHKQYDKL